MPALSLSWWPFYGNEFFLQLSPLGDIRDVRYLYRVCYIAVLFILLNLGNNYVVKTLLVFFSHFLSGGCFKVAFQAIQAKTFDYV